MLLGTNKTQTLEADSNNNYAKNLMYVFCLLQNHTNITYGYKDTCGALRDLVQCVQFK